MISDLHLPVVYDDKYKSHTLKNTAGNHCLQSNVIFTFVAHFHRCSIKTTTKYQNFYHHHLIRKNALCIVYLGFPEMLFWFFLTIKSQSLENTQVGYTLHQTASARPIHFVLEHFRLDTLCFGTFRPCWWPTCRVLVLVTLSSTLCSCLSATHQSHPSPKHSLFATTPA